MAIHGGRLYALAALAGTQGFTMPVDTEHGRIQFGRGYCRVVEARENGTVREYLKPKHYGEFIRNRGSIRNVYNEAGVKTGIRYV